MYIPRVKKSFIAKCEKEIVHLVHNYSVTEKGGETTKNVLKLTYFFCERFSCFFKGLFYFLVIFSTQHQK